MQETLKKILQKVIDFFYAITKKLDEVSESIKDKTGININVTAIVGAILLIIILVIFIKGILGWVGNSLTGGNFS
jgi:hypothetical protein